MPGEQLAKQGTYRAFYGWSISSTLHQLEAEHVYGHDVYKGTIRNDVGEGFLRSRLPADGVWFLCLYAHEGVALRQPLRAGGSRAKLVAIIVPGWQRRRDRGADERLALQERSLRGALVQLEGLCIDPHLEMHTRGG